MRIARATAPTLRLTVTGATLISRSAAARLMRTYVAQVEAFRHLRQAGSQFMRVEHVHVNEGGQALIGNVRKESIGRAEGEN